MGHFDPKKPPGERHKVIAEKINRQKLAFIEPHIGAKFQKIPALGYGDTQDRPDGRTDGRTGLNFKVQSLLRRGTKKPCVRSPLCVCESQCGADKK